jgi:putative addiction module component (TIGR02574 family)
MPITLEQIKEHCAVLPSDQRAELAYFLLHSLDEAGEPDASAAWLAEVRSRVADIRSGGVTGKPAEHVFAEVRKRYA